jgi:hypothetical protein
MQASQSVGATHARCADRLVTAGRWWSSQYGDRRRERLVDRNTKYQYCIPLVTE